MSVLAKAGTITLPAIRINSVFKFSSAKNPFLAATAPNKNEPSTLDIEIFTVSAATADLSTKPATTPSTAKTIARNFMRSFLLLIKTVNKSLVVEFLDKADFGEILGTRGRRLGIGLHQRIRNRFDPRQGRILLARHNGVAYRNVVAFFQQEPFPSSPQVFGQDFYASLAVHL